MRERYLAMRRYVLQEVMNACMQINSVELNLEFEGFKE